MLSIKNEVKGLKNIDKVLSMIGKSQDQKSMNSFFKEKVQEVLIQVMSEKLVGGTTNDEWIDEYKKNNVFIDTDNGFILKNDTTIPQNMLDTKHPEDYPNGFSIALAFEYGTGIVGESSPKEGHWEYNVNKYNWAWIYLKNGTKYSTYGYEGMEIYRTITQKVNSNLKNWVKEYMNRSV